VAGGPGTLQLGSLQHFVGACPGPDQCPHGCNQHLKNEEEAESPPSASGKGTDLKSWDVRCWRTRAGTRSVAGSGVLYGARASSTDSRGMRRCKAVLRRYSDCSRWKYPSTAMYLFPLGVLIAAAWRFFSSIGVRESNNLLAWGTWLGGSGLWLSTLLVFLWFLLVRWKYAFVLVSLSSVSCRPAFYSCLPSPFFNLAKYSSWSPSVGSVCINLFSTPPSPLKVFAVRRRDSRGYSSAFPIRRQIRILRGLSRVELILHQSHRIKPPQSLMKCYQQF